MPLPEVPNHAAPVPACRGQRRGQRRVLGETKQPSATHSSCREDENATPKEMDTDHLKELFHSSTVKATPEAQRLVSPTAPSKESSRPRCSSLESHVKRPLSRAANSVRLSTTPTKQSSSAAREMTPPRIVEVSKRSSMTQTSPMKLHSAGETGISPVVRAKGNRMRQAPATVLNGAAHHAHRQPAPPQYPPHSESAVVGGVGPSTPVRGSVGRGNDPSPSPDAPRNPPPTSVDNKLIAPLVSPPASLLPVAAVLTAASVKAVRKEGLPTRKGEMGPGTVGGRASNRRNTSLDTELNYRPSADPTGASCPNAASPSPAHPVVGSYHPGEVSSNNNVSCVVVDPSNMEGAPSRGLPCLQRGKAQPQPHPSDPPPCTPDPTTSAPANVVGMSDGTEITMPNPGPSVHDNSEGDSAESPAEEGAFPSSQEEADDEEDDEDYHELLRESF